MITEISVTSHKKQQTNLKLPLGDNKTRNLLYFRSYSFHLRSALESVLIVTMRYPEPPINITLGTLES